MSEVPLASNVTANGTETAVNPDPVRENTWQKTNTFIVYVDQDASTWPAATINVWAVDRGGRTYKPGSSTQMTPSGAGAVIVTIGDGHELQVNVADVSGDDLYVYAASCRGVV